MPSDPPSDRDRRVPTDPPAEPSPPQPKKRRRWLKRLAVLAILILVAVWAINGPIFRWALGSIVPDQLEKRGITLQWEAGGSLWSGINCREISVETNESTGVVSSTTAGSLEVDLDWWRWLRGNLAQPVTRLDLLGVSTDARLLEQEKVAEPPKPKKNERPAGEQAGDLFQTIQRFTAGTRARIEIETLRLTTPSTQTFEVENAELTVDRAEAISLSLAETSVAGFDPMLGFQLELKPKDRRVRLQNFALGDAVQVKLAALTLADDEQLRITLDSHLFGGDLSGEISEDRTFAFEITNGEIDFDALDQFLESLFDKRLFLPSGRITKLSLAGKLGAGKVLETLEADTRLNVVDFALGKRRLGDISLHAGAENATLRSYVLSVKAPHKHLELKNATLPVSKLTHKRPWTQITTESLRLEVADLHEALSEYHVRPGDAMPALAVVLEGTTAPSPHSDAWYPHATLNALGRPLADALDLDIEVDVDSDGAFHSPIDWQVRVRDNVSAPAIGNPEIAGSGTFTIKSLGLTGDLALQITPEFPLAKTVAWSGAQLPIDGDVTLDATSNFDMRFGKNAHYTGTCRVNTVKLIGASSFPDLTASLEAGLAKNHAYARNLEAEVNELNIAGGVDWKNKRLGIPRLTVTHDNSGAKLDLTADLPFPLKSIASPEVLLESADPIELKLSLKAASLADFDPLLELGGLSSDSLGISSGEIDVEVDVTRTKRADHAPAVDLAAQIDQLRIASDPIGEPISIQIDLSADQSTQLDAAVKYGDLTSLKMTGRMPWEPLAWVKKEREISSENLEVDALVESIPLEPFAPLAPVIEELKGSLTVRARMTGSVGNPMLSGSTNLQVAVARFDLPVFPGLRDLSLKTSTENNQLTITDGSFESAGGKYELGGTVDLSTMTQPAFDLRLATDEALVYRDDAMTIRADANLTYTGTLAESTLAGDVGLVRPLYYKEFNILSTDSTGGAGTPHQLPTFSTTPTGPATDSDEGNTEPPAPSFLDTCKLDVHVTTADKARVRTDIATADAVAAVHVGGSLKKPELFGEAKVLRGSAQLPFTRIDVTQATAVFRPAYGLTPRINVQAQSQAARHTIQIFVSGSATAPQVIFTSTPYLPRQDVLTLLATGSTRSNLEGGGSAALKAVMLLSQKVAADQDRSRIMRWIAGSLRFISNIEVGIGETNRLTGKRSNSAEAELTDRLRFRVEYDESDSRAALIYNYPLD
ncbi:translocation/assembly module TamB domain-containing protein [Sulfuriroseicoccus oceanibius]|uniref:Translocation/assembly module TamB domain-containing protein n=1 Tax=Sulfuriroseicoccus oceanibius TaxID=2707525 RepID=A0A7T7EZU2_9BACT|nr:translocation/assembly module TamB domain-containing protein [Sulfuriroseicoccus oceanibius]QQL44107.1 translocation/assembly module TamB domain-containing protein [Sulfuriroseicoccus oceanibius]